MSRGGGGADTISVLVVAVPWDTIASFTAWAQWYKHNPIVVTINITNTTNPVPTANDIPPTLNIGDDINSSLML